MWNLYCTLSGNGVFFAWDIIEAVCLRLSIWRRRAARPAQLAGARDLGRRLTSARLDGAMLLFISWDSRRSEGERRGRPNWLVRVIWAATNECSIGWCAWFGRAMWITLNLLMGISDHFSRCENLRGVSVSAGNLRRVSKLFMNAL